MSETRRRCYSAAAGGLGGKTAGELWEMVLEARANGDTEALDQANAELERRQREADKFTAKAERSIVLFALAVTAAATLVFCLGVWKLFELCSGFIR
jgi:hypothetical protein